MTGQRRERMRAYWDDRARVNAAWYVDTSLGYDDPDMEKFWETGRRIAANALDSSPTQTPSFGLALEIGSGLGRVCKGLAERFDRVIGIDISPEMVERARSLVPDERITFEVGDGATLTSIQDGSVDLVVSFTVFQHIPAVSVIESYIHEVGRVLKQGGVFSFQWNNMPRHRLWSARRRAISLLRRVGIRFHETRDPAFLGSRVPLRRIRVALQESGMEYLRAERLGQLFAWAWAVKR